METSRPYFIRYHSSMNALWLTRMCAYKHSPQALTTAKRLIGFKIERESVLLRRYKQLTFTPDFAPARTIGNVLLIEARAAKHFRHAFRLLISPKIDFVGRTPGGRDLVNKLLDIGYHHVTNIVRKFLEARDVPAALGLLHVARKSDSAPLAYDLVELSRADTVDAEVLRFLRLKKKPLVTADKEVAHFLHEINERIERPHYLKDFCRCHSYRYYMEVQMLKFISAVNHVQPFEPMLLPARHETRCQLTQEQAVLSSAPDRSSSRPGEMSKTVGL